MHLRFLAYGIEHELKDFEKWWSTRVSSIPYEYKGQKREGLAQIGLREVKMYDLVFPKEALNVILNTLKPENCVVSRVDGKGTKMFKNALNMIRKAMRLKKIPEVPKEFTQMLPIIKFPNVRVVGLGVQEDHEIEEPNGTKHESI